MLPFNLLTTTTEGLQAIKCLNLPKSAWDTAGRFWESKPFSSSLTTWFVSPPFPFRTHRPQPAPLPSHLLWLKSAERISDLAHEDEFARLVCTFQSRALYCSP